MSKLKHKSRPDSPAKAIYERITLPRRVRQERRCTSNYLIRADATRWRGSEGWGVKVEKGAEREQ